MSKKTILLVDDNIAFLHMIHDVFDLEEEYSNKLEVKLFGQHKVGEIQKNNVSMSLQNYLEKNKNNFIADVIFCDYDLGYGNTVLDVLKYAKGVTSLPPIVVMTAGNNTVQADAIKSIEEGARGYIIKSPDFMKANNANDYFLQELLLTTLRVDREHKQHTIHKIITEISKDSHTDNSRTLVQNFVDIFSLYYPYFTTVIREYKESKLVLLASNLKDQILEEEINELTDKDAPFLFELIHSQEGITINNDFPHEKLGLRDETKILIDNLNLKKGILIRVGSRDNPLGTISIYCGSDTRDFSEEQKDDFILAARSIERDWKLLDKENKSKRIIQFIDDVVREDDETVIWQKLCLLVHKDFNQNSQETKTTIKVAKVGSDELERDYCEGIDCDTERIINTFDKTVSSWVYRNNHYCYINSDSFIDIKSNPKQLTEDFKDQLCGENKDRHIEFNQTQDDMISEICLPIAIKDEVFAILNIESNIENTYNSTDAKSIRKEIEKLVKVCANRVNNIRQKKFMEDMIAAISNKTYKKRFSVSKKFLKEFIGYNTFSVFIKKDNKLYLEYLELNPRVNRKSYNLIKQKIENGVNKKSMIQDFSEITKDYSYIPKGKNEKNFAQIQEIVSKSQFLARLKIDEITIGVVSFEFPITNPLNSRQIELLEGFIAWFARDIKDNLDFLKQTMELTILHENLADISHTYKDYINIQDKITQLREEGKTFKDISIWIGNFTAGLKYIFSIGSLEPSEKNDEVLLLAKKIDNNSTYIKKLRKFIDSVPYLLDGASKTIFKIEVSGTTSLRINVFKILDLEAIFFEYIFNAIKINKAYGSHENMKKKIITIKFLLTDDAIYLANDGYPIKKEDRNKIFDYGFSQQAKNPDISSGLGMGLNKCRAYLNNVRWESTLVEHNNIAELEDSTVIFKFSKKEKND